MTNDNNNNIVTVVIVPVPDLGWWEAKHLHERQKKRVLILNVRRLKGRADSILLVKKGHAWLSIAPKMSSKQNNLMV